MIITDGKPWACLNCKSRLTDAQESCGKCGDRVKRKQEQA